MRRLSAGARRGGATMFRRTLEAVAQDRSSEAAIKKLDADRPLAGALGAIAHEGALDKSLSEWAKEVRLAGKVGGHFDPIDDVIEDEAPELNRLVRGVLHYLLRDAGQSAPWRRGANVA